MSTPLVKTTAILSSIGPLSNIEIISGTVSLDGSRVPYAAASVTVARTDIPDLDDVDPRGGIRAEIVVSDGTTTRDFDLSVQSMTVDPRNNRVTFELASDEALLEQYTAMADDLRGAYGVMSLSTVINRVLNDVTGGSITTADSVSAATAVASTNLIRNPRVGAGITDWVAVGGLLTTRYTSGGPLASAPSYFGFQAPPGGGAVPSAQVLYDQQAVSVSPGKKYVLTAWVYADGARGMRLQAIAFDGTNNARAYTAYTDVTPNYTWKAVGIVFTAGPEVTRIRPTVTPIGGLSAGEYIRVSALRLSEWTGGGDLVTQTAAADAHYFDGSSPSGVAPYTGGPIYSYEWVGEAHASISKRTPVGNYPTPQQMTWPAGEKAWEFIRRVCTFYKRRLWCDEDRVWRMMNPDTWSVAGTVEIVGMNSVDVSDTIALGDPDEYATGVIAPYEWTSQDGTRNRVLDVAGTPEQVRVMPAMNAPYPGPGVAQEILDRMSGRGAVIDVTALTNYAATPGMTAEITLPGEATRELYLMSVSWDLRTRLMSVGTRALIV